MPKNYLVEYQKKLGLKPDGILGPKTAQAMMSDLGMTDKLFFAHMMGQMAHESGMYTNARENLNYSAARLLDIFGKYYDRTLAQKHQNKPKAIANHVYANRMGNGNEASGDGWKYRGIFGLQLTGKTNITGFIKSLGLPESTDPESLLFDPKNYFLSGKFWFEQNRAHSLCTSTSTDCILSVSRKVNIGTSKTTRMPHGFDDRKKQTVLIFKALGIS